MDNGENTSTPVIDAPIDTPIDTPMDPPINVTHRVTQVVVLGLVLLVGCVVYRFLHPATTFAADGDERWNAAVEQSRAAHTPALVLFSADWCPACQALHSDVLCRQDIQDEIGNHYTMITVDMTLRTPSVQARASKFGVSAIPTLIRFDAEGKETSRTHNISAEKMLAWLREGE